MKRDPIKYIRDLCKSAYEKDTKCFICETTEELQFHHFNSMTLLWNKWCKDSGLKIETEQDILDNREQFRDKHKKEIYEDTVTLCKFHHMDRLHVIYGKCPPLNTAQKQKRWCQKQKDKYLLKEK